MKPIFLPLFFAFLLIIVSCKSNKSKNPAIEQGWIQRELSSGWQLYVPPDFICKSLKGIDSEPGMIYSKKDSIFLQYDSGTGGNNDCDFQKAKAEIDTGFYKRFYKVPYIHKAYIDTIDNKIAIIMIPTKVGDGTTQIVISDCKNKTWLGIEGRNLSRKKERLVLKIFKTIILKTTN